MDRDVITIGANKSKAVKLLLISLVFAAVGAGMLNDNSDTVWVAWFSVGLGVLSAPLWIYQLSSRSAGELRIDRNGIELRNLFKTTRLAWHDVKGFRVGHIPTLHGGRHTMIAIEYASSYSQLRTGRRLNSLFTGMEGALPDQFNRPAEEVCAVLNQAKKRWETNSSSWSR